MSLASSAISVLRSSDVDIHRAVFLDDVEFLQPDAAVADVDAGLEMELIGVPGADDMHVVAVVILAEEGSVGRDDVDDLRHSEALADRAALMRAVVAIGVIFTALADHADLDLAGGDDAHPAIGDLAVFADQYFSHSAPIPSLSVAGLPRILPSRLGVCPYGSCGFC